MMIEQWRPVPNYEGAYEISNLWRVRSVKRVVMRSDGRAYTVKARILRPRMQNRTGLEIVALSDHGEQRRHYVHRLAEAAGWEGDAAIGHRTPEHGA
jgi:hypothetical protein